MSPVVEVQSPNHGTAREVSKLLFYEDIFDYKLYLAKHISLRRPSLSCYSSFCGLSGWFLFFF